MRGRKVLLGCAVVTFESTIQDAVGDSNLIIAATGNPEMRVEEHIRVPAYTQEGQDHVDAAAHIWKGKADEPESADYQGSGKEDTVSFN